MPSHYSTIGFGDMTYDEIAGLGEKHFGRMQAFETDVGTYVLLSGEEGEELWYQVDNDQALIGAHPHFAGRSSLRIGIVTTIVRPTDTPLDGAVHGWADPPGSEPEHGAYPFVFDTPNFRTYGAVDAPRIVTAQIAAFAHEIDVYESPEAYDDAQSGEEVAYASKSFLPSGLFVGSEDDGAPPEAVAIMTGHVVEAAVRKNTFTGANFYWALLDTFGGQYDVVVDASLLPECPRPGFVINGSFWLSGKITSGL